MRIGPILGSMIIVILMILFQWPKINPNQKKEKAVFITFTILGWLLINIMFIYPNIPGPSQLIDYLYKPLGKLLE